MEDVSGRRYTTYKADIGALIKRATPTDPQVITLTLPNAVKLNSYGMVTLWYHPLGRGHLKVVGDERRLEHSFIQLPMRLGVQRRDYTIPTSNQGTYDQYRWVLLAVTVAATFTLLGMFLYTAPAKFMIKDGDTFYSVESAVVRLLYEPMTTTNNTDKPHSVTTEYTQVSFWKVFPSRRTHRILMIVGQLQDHLQ